KEYSTRIPSQDCSRMSGSDLSVGVLTLGISARAGRGMIALEGREDAVWRGCDVAGASGASPAGVVDRAGGRRRRGRIEGSRRGGRADGRGDASSGAGGVAQLGRAAGRGDGTGDSPTPSDASPRRKNSA